MTDLSAMTWDVWKNMPEHRRAPLRDLSGLTPQLAGLEGWRVEVVDCEGDKPRRFNVGRSTGWRPCHLEIHNARSTGGFAACGPYHSVRTIRRVR